MRLSSTIGRHGALGALLCSTLAACGGSTPPPKTDEDAPAETARRQKPDRGGPVVEQELGSIDQRAVEKTFEKIQGRLEGCHKQGRDRVEFLAGDIKVFLRIGKDGRVRYAFFDETTLGDRDTEKCILDVFSGTDWPKPQGGEAEVRNGFGWSPGGERPPTPWGPEKVSSALDADRATKTAVDKCKAGVSGDFRVTAYVEPGEVEAHGGDGDAKEAAAPGKGAGHGTGAHGKKNGSGGGAHKADKKAAPAQPPEHGGKFKAIGVAPPGKDGADKIDCIVDALKGLSLPSPGSYAAKVTFPI